MKCIKDKLCNNILKGYVLVTQYLCIVIVAKGDQEYDISDWL